MEDLRRGRSLLSEGVAVGLLGAAVVAVWFLVVDLMAGAPLRTPGALGSALFLGVRDAAQVEVSGITVGLYTLFHGVAFVLIGLGAAALLRAADRAPATLALILLVTAVLEALFVGGVTIVAEFLLGLLAWWAVLGGNVLASLAMGSLLLRWHPATAERLKHAGEALPEA